MLLRKEIEDLEEETASRLTTENWSILRVLKEPLVRLPLMLVCALQLGQQLSGINAVFYYSNGIFESAGLNENESQYATIGTGLANVIMALVSVLLNSLFGRRTLLFISCCSTVGCLVGLCFSILYIVRQCFSIAK